LRGKKRKKNPSLSFTLHCSSLIIVLCHGSKEERTKEEQSLDWGCRPLAIICFCAHTEFRDSKVVISRKTQKHR
jgi:hypothetical protein